MKYQYKKLDLNLNYSLIEKQEPEKQEEIISEKIVEILNKEGAEGWKYLYCVNKEYQWRERFVQIDYIVVERCF